MSTTNPFRVLCLDGGGMRGLYTASVLNTLSQRFSQQQNLDIGKGFDLIVGTSTGGILACALSAGIPIKKIIDLYRMHGPKIFTCPIPRNGFSKLIWALKNSIHSANNNDYLKRSLEQIFGLETIGEVYNRRKIGLCLPTVNISTHEARVFKTAHDPKKNADDKRKLVDVCLATSAAPIILPIASINNPHLENQSSHFVDGGLWANNPVLVGLIEALQMTDTNRIIEIISIGTCPPPSGGSILAHETSRGVLGWNVGIKALELSMDAQASGYQYMAEFLVGYLKKCSRDVSLLRFDQSAPSSEQANYIGLDNASERACSTLMELGNSDALKIHGLSLRENNEYNRLRTIFQSMPELNKEEPK